MKILHTADLHLNAANPERWAALETLVAIAGAKQAALLVVAGDLFDRNVEAETLRGELRKALGGRDLKTVILPGNHDRGAYRSGLYFGHNVYVINSWSEPLDFGEAVIWGLPYEKLEGERLVGRLREMAALMDRERHNILLFHGELLDAYFSRSAMGEEGDQRYMPVRLSYFDSMPVSYVLAGHFHSRYSGWELAGGGLFIYPGSPVAVTRRETGRRTANLVSGNERPLEIELDTLHYEALTINLDPFAPLEPLLKIEQELARLNPAARVILTVQGLYDGGRLNLTEEELAAGIRRVAGGRLAGEPAELFADVQHILDDELFKKFDLRLQELSCVAHEQALIRELTVKAFRAVKGCS